MRFSPCLPLAPLAVLLAGCSGGPAIEPWIKAFGNDLLQQDIHLAAAPSGDLLITGTYAGGIDFGGGPLPPTDASESRVFVASLSAEGEHRWSLGAGAQGFQRGTGAAFDAGGNAVFAGGFNAQLNFGAGSMVALTEDIWLASFDPGGRFRWQQHWGADDGGPAGVGSSSPIAGLAIGGDGGLIIGGSFTGTLGFGGDPIYAEDSNTFVAKLDPTGRQRIARAFGGSSHEALAVAADAQGSFAVAGINRGTLTIDGQSITATSLIALEERAFVARFDAAGDLSFLRQLQSEGSSQSRAVAMAADGAVVLAGCATGTITMFPLTASRPASTSSSNSAADGFVVSLAPDGTPRWLTLLPAACVSALAIDDAGHVHAGGTYAGVPDLGGGPLPASLGFTAFTVELDELGAYVTHATLPTEDGESLIISLAAVPGGLVASGLFTGTIHLGSTARETGFDADLFVARLR